MFISSGLAFAVSAFLLIGTDIQIGSAGTFVIGIIPMLFFIFYIYSLRLTYKHGETDDGVEALKDADLNVSVKKASLLFTV